MKTPKNSKLQKTLDKYKKYTIVSVISVILLTLLITNTNILEPVINEKTAKYISFNNTNNTDMLEINNIKKMPNFLGKTKFNKNSISFVIESNNKSNYEIFIYPSNNNIPNKYIHYYLKSDKFSKEGTLNKNSNDGISIYKGKVNKKKITLRMWIDNKYKNNKNNNFEVIIKSR